MGANAKKKIEAECAPQAIALQTIAVYRRAMERRPGAGGCGEVVGFGALARLRDD
jgi:hypothetical protein